MTDLLDRLKAALADRYDIEQELGSGGMATVYLAQDLKHLRKVAVKLLHPELSHTIGVERFLREIQVIARLQHPHILTLIDSGDADGIPYYVMPFVTGQSLANQLAAGGPLSLARAVEIVREIADGLHYAHEHGVIHRDIKLANILISGGHAVIADFGIATAIETATMGRITQTGISLGSPVYMSPEQAAGERQLDRRTDIYSLGCVFYELLAGEPPIVDHSMQAVVTRKLLGEFRPLREVRDGIPRAVQAAMDRALSTSREDRFDDARAFSEALTRGVSEAREGSTRTVARRWGLVTAAAAAAVFVAAMGVMFARTQAGSARLIRATQQLGELEVLASTSQFALAFTLGRQLDSVIPFDTTLGRLRPMFTDFIPVRTSPPGANVYRQWYDAPADEWEFVGHTPVDSLPVVRYGVDLAMRIKIEAEGYRTVELLPHALATWAEWRRVFPRDTIPLDREDAIPEGMVRLPGFSISDALHEDGDSIRFGDYLLSRFEVTNREYKAFVDAGWYRMREHWTQPFMRDGREVTWDEAMAAFEDETGRPGPSTWRLGTYPDGEDDYPVGGVSFYEAAAYARFRGMELPTAQHWGRARRYTRESIWIISPRSNLSATGPRPVGADRSMNALGIYDLAGNVREWCVNPMPTGRLTRGAAWSE